MRAYLKAMDQGNTVTTGTTEKCTCTPYVMFAPRTLRENNVSHYFVKNLKKKRKFWYKIQDYFEKSLFEWVATLTCVLWCCNPIYCCHLCSDSPPTLYNHITTISYLTAVHNWQHLSHLFFLHRTTVSHRERHFQWEFHKRSLSQYPSHLIWLQGNKEGTTVLPQANTHAPTTATCQLQPYRTWPSVCT